MSAIDSPYSLATLSPPTSHRHLPSLLHSSAPTHRTQHLRKPFKIATFLHAVIELRSIPLPRDTTESESIAESTSLTSGAAATPASASSSSSSSSSIVESMAVTSQASPPQHPEAQPQASSSRRSTLPSSSAFSRLSSAPSSRSSKLTPISSTYPLRIALAEDNVMNQKLMVMLLRKLGYEIHVASNGCEVLTMMDHESSRGSEFEVEVILMDASMDIMDGLECTRVIRSQQLPHRIRPFIVALTANAADEYRTRCLESGMDLFLTKPVQVEALIDALQQAYKWHKQHNQDKLKRTTSAEHGKLNAPSKQAVNEMKEGCTE